MHFGDHHYHQWHRYDYAHIPDICRFIFMLKISESKILHAIFFRKHSKTESEMSNMEITRV